MYREPRSGYTAAETPSVDIPKGKKPAERTRKRGNRGAGFRSVSTRWYV